MLLLSQQILLKDVGIDGIENFLVGMAWGFAQVSHRRGGMAAEFCYACLCEEALNILLDLQILIQVEAGHLFHIWGFQTGVLFSFGWM